MDHTQNSINEALGVPDALNDLIDSEMDKLSQFFGKPKSEIIEHLLRKFIGDTDNHEHLAFWLGFKFSNHLTAMRMAQLSQTGQIVFSGLKPCDNPDCEACHPKSESKILLGGKPGEC